MPTYEYACRKCGKTFDIFQRITAAPLTRCPSCKKGRIERLISGGAGLLFKGSGFYQTDYRSSGYREAAKKEKDASSPAGAGNGKSASPKTDSGSSSTAPASSKAD